MRFDTLVIGGGAAGVFSALSAKIHFPESRVALLEKTATMLAKVRISGGGRCNVTHFCFDPMELSKNYPRGQKELVGPFHNFGPKDTIGWFESRGVKIKKEEDGRMFPISDNSQSIIDCLLSEAKKIDVKILLQQKISSIKKESGNFEIYLKDGTKIQASKLVLATGSSPFGHKVAKELGHSIQKTLPSLFTFNIANFILKELSGISVASARVNILKTKFSFTGPVLITHFGFSGPAVLKLSAFAAIDLFEKDYNTKISINWLGDQRIENVLKSLLTLKNNSPSKALTVLNPFKLPKKLWKHFLETQGIALKLLSHTSLKDLKALSRKLCEDIYEIKGKTTNKEEFVTCGGVSLKEVNFKTMESKICKGLYLAGEILDIDGITGGFNFQNAWTTGYIAGQNITKTSFLDNR